ncbi:PqiC family protein [uncultured Desulfobacter sp.]|uniref:PqiC family protein n=1 Tax=uncultured Desulfobacter sp. TaxID=240139 RepID=UPI0029F56593|nr:PqiC family protein [uncultured Desulfobacter sp.]
MKRFGLHILLISGLMMVSGCGLSPQSSFYLLEGTSSPTPLDQAGPDLSVGIGFVDLPTYLDRSEIVTRKPGNAMTVNEFQRWGAPLEHQIREKLMMDLSALLGTARVVLSPWERALSPEYQVDLTLLRFELNGGQAVMDALWYVRDVKTEKLMISQCFSSALPVPGKDITAYVRVQVQALENLVRDIAVEITAMGRPGLSTPRLAPQQSMKEH